MSYIAKHFEEASNIISKINFLHIEKMVDTLYDTRNNKGRLFVLGVGGSAANASHLVNDFRKICSIEAYAPTDNISEITARTNDEGWDTVFEEWLKTSQLRSNDCLLVLSVGGGDENKNVSTNLIKAIKYAKSQKAKTLGIIGKKNGFTYQNAEISCLVPIVNKDNITPHSEAFQSVIWHAMVSHPKLKVNKTKW